MDHLFLAQTGLFQGLTEQEIKSFLTCVQSREKHFKKGEIIFHSGDEVKDAGLILEGSVNVVLYHYWGGASILGHKEKGSLFGEAYAAIPGRELLYDVAAAEDSSILFFNMERLLSVCSESCAFHQRIIRNMIRISAESSLSLVSRMMHIAPHTIRERLLSYLSEQAVSAGSSSFTIPFSRQQLADYLGVDRSALSNELSRMRKEGLLTVRKNAFTLLDKRP